MKLFNKNIKKVLIKARADERLKCEQEFSSELRLKLKELEDKKNLEIAEVEAEMTSMKIHVAYWKERHEKSLKREQQNKIIEKRNAKLANDMYYLVNEKAKSDAEIISNMGSILSEAGIKAIGE